MCSAAFSWGILSSACSWSFSPVSSWPISSCRSRRSRTFRVWTRTSRREALRAFGCAYRGCVFVCRQPDTRELRQLLVESLTAASFCRRRSSMRACLRLPFPALFVAAGSGFRKYRARASKTHDVRRRSQAGQPVRNRFQSSNQARWIKPKPSEKSSIAFEAAILNLRPEGVTT